MLIARDFPQMENFNFTHTHTCTHTHTLSLSLSLIHSHTYTLFLSPSPPPSSHSLYAVKPELPANYEAETWSKLSEVIIAVQLHHSISYSLEELYQAVENICSHKMAANLYSNLKVECDRHVCGLIPCFEQYP